MPFAKTASLLLATLMLVPAAALAASDSFSGLLDGSYDYSRVPSGKSVDSDQYTVHGSLLYTLDNPGLNFQLEGGDDFYFAIKHNDAHLWNAGGSLFWRDNKGTIGISGSYFSVDAPALPLFARAEIHRELWRVRRILCVWKSHPADKGRRNDGAGRAHPASMAVVD